MRHNIFLYEVVKRMSKEELESWLDRKTSLTSNEYMVISKEWSQRVTNA